MEQPGRVMPERKTIEKTYLSRTPGYRSVVDMLVEDLRNLFARKEIHAAVKGRVKTFESYYQKLLRILKEHPLKSRVPVISDILGVRVVCPFLEDLKAVEDALLAEFRVVKIERKGVERSVREFGYVSTHLLVRVPAAILNRLGVDKKLPCEIQILTILQEAWSEVEHDLVYKADFSPFDEPLKRKLAALNAMLTLSDVIFQEIRDYQNRLHELLRKRRESFTNVARAAVVGTFPNTFSEEMIAEAIRSMEGGPQELGPAALERSNVDDFLLQALNAHNAGRFDLAVDLYTRILGLMENGPVRAVILVHRGMAQIARSDYAEALGDFTRAVESDSECTKAFYCRGVVRSIKREYREALADLNRSLELDLFHFDSLYSRAQVHYQLGNNHEALADCERALNVDPTDRQVAAFRELVRSQIGL